MIILNLNGEWVCHRASTEEEIPGIVPGCVHLDLLRNGFLDDMNWRDNESRHQWVAEEDWVYTRTFEVSAEMLAADCRILQCNGLDTLAEIFVNGESVLSANNMFRTWEVDLRDLLHIGKNRIDVQFSSPVPYMQSRNDEFSLPCWNSYDERYRGKSWLRKMACSFGWDWGLMAPTCGIWRTIRIVGIRGAMLKDVSVQQVHRDGVVDLKIMGTVKKYEYGSYNCVARLEKGHEKVIAAEVEFDGDSAELNLTVDSPELWWPNGLGKQPLYDLVVELLDDDDQVLDVWRRRIGLRSLELDRHKDQWGESFQFVINGVPFFAKGANWVPADILIPRLTRADYERLLGDAASANMNMVRAWGGGFYEQDAFYDVCDELGLLVWQDFMFACSTYPTFDDDFMESVEAEARDNIRRLRIHPSLALWCGNNELEQGLVGDEWGERTMSWHDYSRLFDHLLPSLIEEMDPDRPYWPCSPHTPHGNRRDFNDPTCGDAHCWDVWFGGKPFEYQRQWQHRFMSEFGFQSFPEPRTIESFTEPGDRNITSYIMDYHQRSANGNRKIFAYMLDWFRMPEGLAETLWLTQVTQAACIQYACEHARRMQPRMMGIIYWQLNDIWPCASWSSIDALGRWKALQYFAKRFYAPLLVSAVEDSDAKTMTVSVSNHRLGNAALRCVWRVTTASGNLLGEAETDVQVASQASCTLKTLDCSSYIAAAGERDFILWMWLYDGDTLVSSNIQTFVPPKHLELTSSSATTTVQQLSPNGCAVVLCAAGPMLYTRLEVVDEEVRFSDNFFHLAAGEERAVEVTGSGTLSAETVRQSLRVVSLADTYAGEN